jgi:hypothetical protein
VAVLIEVLRGKNLRVEAWRSRKALEVRGLIALMPPCSDGTRHYRVTEAGYAVLKGYHVHSRLCYEGAAGIGGFGVTCNKVEGEPV